MAEFTEVIIQRSRMCEAFIGCDECPLEHFSEGISCREFIYTKPKKAEEIIMKWAAEHPIMTNAQKFKEVFGCEIHRGGYDCIGIEHDCFKLTCKECQLKGFWGKEYKEPKERRGND